jgi:hypothetical protein
MNPLLSESPLLIEFYLRFRGLGDEQHSLLVVATIHIAAAVIAAFVIAGAVALGVRLGKRLGRLIRPPGQRGGSLRQTMRHSHAQLRKELTPNERRFYYGYIVVGMVVPSAAIWLLFLGRGTARAVGIGLLLLALLVMAVPISPFLRARVRRRERASSNSK